MWVTRTKAVLIIVLINNTDVIKDQQAHACHHNSKFGLGIVAFKLGKHFCLQGVTTGIEQGVRTGIEAS